MIRSRLKNNLLQEFYLEDAIKLAKRLFDALPDTLPNVKRFVEVVRMDLATHLADENFTRKKGLYKFSMLLSRSHQHEFESGKCISIDLACTKPSHKLYLIINLAMRRDNDKYQFREPFGRDIRKKMIESQKKALTGVERNLKLGQLKPTMLATVGHVANGIIQPEKKPPIPVKQEKKVIKKTEKVPKKKKGTKRKKGAKKETNSDAEDVEVTKKSKKGDSKTTSKNFKSISDISLAEFDNIRNQFPGMTKIDFCMP